MQDRIAKEIQHGRFLAEHGAGEIWNWEGQAGRLRWSRRVEMFTKHLRAGMRVLELGCGTGYFTRELVRSVCRSCAAAVDQDAPLEERLAVGPTRRF